MEKIEIKDFVGIKDITIEIKQINILIGPQASGKSVIAKLLFYFKNFISEMLLIAGKSKEIVDFNNSYKQKFKRLFPSYSWGEDYFIIKYTIDNQFIEIARKKEKKNNNNFEIELKYSDFFNNFFAGMVATREVINNSILEQENSYNFTLSSSLISISIYSEIKKQVRSLISQDFNKIVVFEQLYIPAGRSFFAHLKNTIFSFLSENNTVDPFLSDFGKVYEDSKLPISLETINDQALQYPELFKEINLLNDQILCGKYLHKDEKDYLQVTEERIVEISNSSSGQQETLPLIIILRRLAFLKPTTGGHSVYIEEPEAHIFPTAQKNIVELISTVYNARKDSLQFFITTHSPYILTAFNNLIQAGILAVDATEEKIEQISYHVPKTRFLNPDEVAVYSLENGYCQSIIDKETGLIDANIIDEVSNELAIQFDELLDLEE